MHRNCVVSGPVSSSISTSRNYTAFLPFISLAQRNGEAMFVVQLQFRAKAGSWSARHNNLGQWLQIDLGNKHTKVTGLATQGRNGYDQWVTKYKVQYSDNGFYFKYYTEQGQIGSKVKSFSTWAQTDT